MKIRIHFRNIRMTPNAARSGVVWLAVRWERTVLRPFGLFRWSYFAMIQYSPWRIRQVYGPLWRVYFFL